MSFTPYPSSSHVAVPTRPVLLASRRLRLECEVVERVRQGLAHRRSRPGLPH